jgi:UDP-N-acetyl-D-mannosaminuronate dehydrogenase
VLGFAFKADTGDTRESAAITLIRNFFVERALVQIYDPQVQHSQIWMDLTEAMPTTPLDASVLLFIYLFNPFQFAETSTVSQEASDDLYLGPGSMQERGGRRDRD